ncbi:hypothetical protein [Streptomyces sp. TRM64462]|uniref:hypothetical protein n=1 Tax=Streptomyces sp. TRM64462 TaxID=2741726 RepID=UPI001586D83A|nr:hypothetical protein [Streptomyces sp. TRM64462]
MKKVKIPSTAPLAYLKAAAEAAKSTLGKPDLLPVNVGGSGYFPYWHRTENNYLYLRTWEYINQNVTEGPDKGDDNGFMEFGDPLANDYVGYLDALGYRMSDEDKRRMREAQEQVKETGTELVRAYEGIYREITQQQMETAHVDTKIDYIASYKLVHEWAGQKGLQLDRKVLQDLERHLPDCPASAKPLIPIIARYLTGLLPVSGLINTGFAKESLLSNLRYNTKNPSKDNGGVLTEDDKLNQAYHVGFTVNDEPAAIHEALQADKGFTVRMDFSNFQETTVDLKIEGQAGGSVSVLGVIGIEAEGSVNYSLHELNSQRVDCTVEVEYKGVTAVHMKPTPYSQDTQAGWYESAPIVDALKNGKNPQDSGWVLSPYPSAGLGVLQCLAVSRFPSIKIKYESGSMSKKTEELRHQASVGISLFGIRLGGGGYDYKCTKVEEHGENQGFTIEFQTPTTITGNPLDRRAYVIACGVDEFRP